MRTLLRGFLVVAALLVATPSYAQQEPLARVGRVSIVEGSLAFYGPGDSDWSAANVNFPAAENGWFATDPDSRAEIRIGAASISLDKNTEAGFTALNDKAMQIALSQGRMNLHLRRLANGETTEVDIVRGGVWLLQPGIYEVDAGGPDQPSRIAVFEGSARFVGGGVDTTVNAGDALVLNGTDTLTATTEPAAPDDFSRWCRSHDYQEDRLAAPYHVSPAMTGFEELDAHGQWAEAADYGPVWYPSSVPDDWAPYREGHWAWVEPWGWNWVDDEPWGFAPFHYGRWARIDDRWGWVPGEFVPDPVYAPALVAFLAPSDYGAPDVGPAVGWFPLAPGEVYWPAYTRDRNYIRNVNITNVNVTVINNMTRAAAAQPAGAPPPQVARQNFANRAAATVVPATVLAQGAKVAPAAVHVPPQALQQASVGMRPPATIASPGATAAPPGVVARPGSFARPSAAQPPRPGAPAPNAPAATAAAAPAGHPAARPNFSHLAQAPQVTRTAAQPAQATAAPPAPGAQPAAPPPQHPGEATATVPPAPGARPPGPPDFSHLAPSRGTRPAPAGPGGAPTAGAPGNQPGIAPPEHPAATVLRPSPGQPPGPPNLSRAAPPPPNQVTPGATPPTAVGHAGPPPGRGEPAHRPGVQPAQGAPPPAGQGGPPPHANSPSPLQPAAGQAAAQQQAQQRAAAQAAAQQQAQQRAAQAAAQQQAQQRAAQAAAQQQAQQRATAQAAAQQQAQQRAAAQAAAQQQAQQRAAQAAQQQQAQQRAAAQAAAQQQAQQRAAAQAAAQQQAQQRAAQAAQQQQAQQRAAQAAQQQHGSSQPHCGHPNEPACPK